MKSLYLILLFLANLHLYADVSRYNFDIIKFDEKYYVPLQNNIVYPDFQKQTRRTYIFLRKCKYIRINLNHKLSLTERAKDTIAKMEKELRGMFKIDYNDINWNTGRIPFVINRYPDKYQDGALYRIKIFIPKKYRHKVLKLFFLGANYIVDVWINGKWIGFHEGGYSIFAFNISDYLKYGKENLIFIRLDNIPWLMDEYPNANEHNIVPYKKMDWWNYTGINRDLYIEVSEKISVARADINYKIFDSKCNLNVYVILNNFDNKDRRVKVKINIYEARIKKRNLLSLYLSLYSRELVNFKRVIYKGKERSIRVDKNSFKVINFNNKFSLFRTIKYWSPSTPHLYVLEVIVKDRNDRIIENNYYQFGVRKFEIKAQKIYLNSNKTPLLLKGTSYHEEFYPYGRAIDESKLKLIVENLNLVKDLNCNFLRTAHYPHHPFTYLLTDRLGIIVWEEIPVMWFDGPELIYQLKNRKIPHQMLLEMIYANYNSPSILFHGLCNECGAQLERREYLWYMKKLSEKVHNNRIYAQSAVGADMTDNTQSDMDVIGATMYYGVFYWDNPYKHTLYALNKMNSYFPDKPIIATEFGYWSGEDQSDICKQAKIAKDTYNAFKDSKVVSGMVWWSLLDWFTMITGYQTMGLITMDKKIIKPAFFELQRLYGNKIKNYSIQSLNLRNNQKIRGSILLQFKISPQNDIKSVKLAIGNLNFKRELNFKNGIYFTRLNTFHFKEGKTYFIVRLKLNNQEVLYKKIDVIVDNYDEPPVVKVNLCKDKVVMKNFILKVYVTDDGKITRCQYKIDAEEYNNLTKNNNYYFAKLRFKNFKNGSIHNLKLLIKDDGKHTIKTNIKFIYNNSPGIKINLPYNLDRISYSNNKKDAYYWSFPAEELPDSNTWVVCNGCNAKLFFPNKKDGANNVVVCQGQYIKVRKGNYSVLNIWGYSYWGNQNNELIIYYDDGTEEKKELLLSEWTACNAQFGDHIAYICSKHYETSGKSGKPAVAFYHINFDLNKNKKLVAIEFPDDTHKHIIAASLEP